MDSVLTVKYKDGKAKLQLFLDRFLPTGKARFKELLKILDMSLETEEHYSLLKAYIEEALPRNKVEISTASECYLDTKQIYAEIVERLESGKAPSGLPLDEETVKYYKKSAKEFKSEIAFFNRSIKALNKKEKQYKDNLECLEAWRGSRW